MPRILIMDDDTEFCGTITSVLERQGYIVSSFLELDVGIKAARSGKYDLVLLDVKFSKGASLSTISRIREADIAPEIVVMTDYGDMKSAELAIEQGAVVYMVKPVSAQIIVDLVTRITSYHTRKYQPCSTRR